MLVLHGSVVLCEEKLVDSTKLGDSIMLSASGRAARGSTLGQGCYAGFLCVLLTASYMKRSGEQKGMVHLLRIR